MRRVVCEVMSCCCWCCDSGNSTAGGRGTTAAASAIVAGGGSVVVENHNSGSNVSGGGLGIASGLSAMLSLIVVAVAISTGEWLLTEEKLPKTSSNASVEPDSKDFLALLLTPTRSTNPDADGQLADTANIKAEKAEKARVWNTSVLASTIFQTRSIVLIPVTLRWRFHVSNIHLSCKFESALGKCTSSSQLVNFIDAYEAQWFGELATVDYISGIRCRRHLNPRNLCFYMLTYHIVTLSFS
ncbi:hypothetical protein M0802_012851 [Mischocyttarus mexicanus]|nr:hypothetical protein M0802_012851 [Mischocyttarus mexicanus]